jgi:hypothetical protein
VNDHIVFPDLIHDYIIADRKSSETEFARRSPDVRGVRYPFRRVFYPDDKPSSRFPIIGSHVCKNFVEIGEGAAFIPKPHALR